MKRAKTSWVNVWVLCVVTLLTGAGSANTRTLETRFALSADSRSQFIKPFPLLSPGRVVIEATWNSNTAGAAQGSLTLILLRPDGTESARKAGLSPLRLEQFASGQDVDSSSSRTANWKVKLLNDADRNKTEATGTLRITIPATSRTLEDTQFTLLGSGNAQEVAFNVLAPGRLSIAINWEPDPLSRGSAEMVPLVVSLIHPGESRTYARRQGTSPMTVEQQATEEALDHGERWIVRVQNDSQKKVKGTLRIIYTPSL